jgi:ribosome biogenesis GTPase A
VNYFETCKQDCVPINAHSKSSVTKLLELVELKLKEAILKEPTLLVMVVGVPNVGKSCLINSIHQIAQSRFPGKVFEFHLNELESLLLLLALTI